MSKKKTQDFFGGFSSIFSTFFNSIKKNQEVFWQFLAHISISNKTQDLLGGFVPIFSLFFNSVNKTQYF